MSERVRQVVSVVIGLALFLAALVVLRIELRAVTWSALSADILQIPPSRLALALLLTVVNYAALTGYDLLAFAHIRKGLPRWRVAGVSLLAYAISNSVGFAMISGATVRYRFHTRWGVTTDELARVVVSYSVTFWMGLLGLGGLSVVVSPPAAATGLSAPLLTAIGTLFLLTPLTYVALAVARRRPLRVGRLEMPLPSPSIAAGQVLLSGVEWALAGAVLFVLLPPSSLSFFQCAGAFLAAALIGMVSHVPGGLGVFEGLMVLLLRPYLSSGQLLPALVVYRAVYYLLPLTIAMLVLVADEVEQRREPAARLTAALGRVAEQLTPRVLSVFTFLSGLVLLLSGATPASAGRLVWLNRVLPLGLIEASHLLGSIAGAALLILSQGVARRLDAAYYLASATIVAGMAASLLKGFDYEEAALLSLVLIILWRARSAFDRRAAFFDARFSPAWTAALVGAVGASVWLGLFAFKHVEYSKELWWQFERQAEVSRFLRASVAASAVLLLFGLARLVGYAPHEAPVVIDADLEDARKAIAAQQSTTPFLVYLRDKSVLFNDDRTAFVMYAVQGRTWVAMGDPVGPDDKLSGLVRRFLERCDDFGGVPVFYEVSKSHLHRYADCGLTFVKLGEEAQVDLTSFSLEGSRASKYRQLIRRLEKDGGVFRVIPPAEVPAVLGELRTVSDDWLTAKATAEKGFSLGFFDEGYLSRFPVAVVEVDGRVRAFANIWDGPQHCELSVDLMRYHRTAPKNVMEALFVHAMLWGHQQGYQRFSLGMAPLSGVESSAVSSIWNRLGAFLYEHGESVYSFQGLRAYKEKFDPTWEPRYLAYPGGLRLPRIVADVSALVAGGYGRIFRK